LSNANRQVITDAIIYYLQCGTRKEPDQVSTSRASTGGSGSIANIKYISHDDEYKTTLEMEYNYYVQVSLEFKEKLLIGNKEKRNQIKKNMQMLIYEQIVPNWTALFMLIRNHQCVFDKY